MRANGSCSAINGICPVRATAGWRGACSRAGTARLSESWNLQFRAEFFNLANHAQFTKVDGNISDGVDFGRVLRARDPRLIQFALKLRF